MAKILYGISSIGLGHATRSIEIVRILRQSRADVLLISGGRPVEFIREEGLAVHDVVSDPVPRVVKGEMKDTFLWYVRSWLAFRETKSRVQPLFDEFRPDLVVGDEEFTCVSLALERAAPAVFVSDELELGFARGLLARYLEKKVLRWYKSLQSRVNLLIVPDIGADEGNIRHVGSIARVPTKSTDQVREQHGLPQSGRMVLLTMSGSGIGGHLVEETMNAVQSLQDKDAFLVVTGNRGSRLQGERVYDLGVVQDNQNLVAAADLVVSTAGKSTIDEASSYGTPIVVIPIRHHAEQERNASALGFDGDDSGRLQSLIAERIGMRTPPMTTAGAAKAAALILEMLPRG